MSDEQHTEPTSEEQSRDGDGRYSTPNETVSASIRASIAELTGETPPEEEKDVSEPPESDEPPEADAAPGEGQSEEQAEGDSEDEPEDLPPLSPPASWTAEEGAQFDALPREVQEVVLRREREREAHFTRQSQEIAPLRNLAQQYSDYYASLGADPATAAQALFAADRVLRSGTPEQKRQMLSSLIQDYGLQAVAGQQAPSEDDVFADPAVSALRAELDQLRSGLMSRQAQEQQAEAQRLQNDVAAFFDAKTEAGEPAHPYIDEVVNDMSALIQARQAQGINPTVADLQTFHEQACWANPDVRAKLLADQQRQQRAREQAEERKRVAKAKAASSSISGVSGAVAARKPDKAPKNEKVRNTIERTIAELQQNSL